MAAHHNSRLATPKQYCTHQHFINNATQCVNIRLHTWFSIIIPQFGRKVVWRTYDTAAHAKATHANAKSVIGQQSRKAKIAQERSCIGSEQNISRFEIAVDNPFAMRIIERRTNGTQYMQSLIPRICSMSFEMVCQATLLCYFHSDIKPLIMFPNFVDCNDMGMFHSRNSFGLTVKAHHPYGITHQERIQHFERHFAVKRSIYGTVNGGKAATTQLIQNAIFP